MKLRDKTLGELFPNAKLRKAFGEVRMKEIIG